MASSSSLLCLTLGLLFLGSCFAQLEGVVSPQRQAPHDQQRQSRSTQLNQCRLENLNTLRPERRIESEAGLTEIWDQNDDQFRCAGVAAVRYTLQSQALLLPGFSNSPRLIYVVRGTGIEGAAIPGCPETFTSESGRSQSRSYRGSSEERGQGQRDQHQKVRRIRQGDILAIPAGVAHWIYNDEQSELVLVSLFDVRNEANQLDETLRKFYLAGNPEQAFEKSGRYERQSSRRSSEGGRQGRNIFSGFDEEILQDAFNIDNQLVRRLQGEGDQRDRIVRVEQDLQVLRPDYEQEEEREERQRSRSQYSRSGRYGGYGNGFDETICTLRLRHNIADSHRADIFNPRAGRLTTLNSYNFPILHHIKLSAERGVLYSNAIVGPQYNLNSHSVIYVTRGNGRLQIVDDKGQNVFDGELEEGQILIVPQAYVVLKRAGNEGFEWIAFKTSENAMTNQLAGRVSAIRALPEDVLVNAYHLSREEARTLKYRRQEQGVFSTGQSRSRDQDQGERSRRGRDD